MHRPSRAHEPGDLFQVVTSAPLTGECETSARRADGRSIVTPPPYRVNTLLHHSCRTVLKRGKLLRRRRLFRPRKGA